MCISIQQPVLVIPGWFGSGPIHWQTRWEILHPEFVRVEQENWEEPSLTDWLAALERSIAATTSPPILLAHSLGCVLVNHWAAQSSLAIAGAFLVAPADVDSTRHDNTPLRQFRPVPRQPLRFPSMVVISSDDPYASLTRVETMAHDWKSQQVLIGALGHINSDSNLGDWKQGLDLFNRFSISLINNS